MLRDSAEWWCQHGYKFLVVSALKSHVVSITATDSIENFSAVPTIVSPFGSTNW